MTRIDLPDDGWAILCSPRKVSERRRRRYIAAVADLATAASALSQIPNPNFGQPGELATTPDPTKFGSTEMELSDRVADALLVCLVKEWSFGDVTEEAVQELPADAFEALFKTCRDLSSQLLPDYSPDPDPKARTSG